MPRILFFRKCIKMIKLCKLFIILILFLHIGCGSSETSDTYEPLSLYPAHTISSLNDTVFISTAYGFHVINNQLLFSDYHNGRIISLSFEEPSINIIYGTIGRGPGEFTATRQFSTYSDSIYAIDEGGLRFHVFHNNGEYIRSFPFPERILTIQHRFAIDNSGKIYARTPYSMNPIIVMNTEGEIINQFGNFIPYDSERKKIARNFGHVLIDSSGNILCIYDSEPIIEFYNNTGTLLNKIDLSRYKFLERRLNFIKDQYRVNPQSRESTFHLLRDVYISDDKLYILYIDHPYKSNNIAVFKISQHTVKLENIFSLMPSSPENNTPHFYSFAVNNNNIFVYDDESDALLVYAIP